VYRPSISVKELEGNGRREGGREGGRKGSFGPLGFGGRRESNQKRLETMTRRYIQRREEGKGREKRRRRACALTLEDKENFRLEKGENIKWCCSVFSFLCISIFSGIRSESMLGK